MKYDIEVVGERCKRKGEDRTLTAHLSETTTPTYSSGVEHQIGKDKWVTRPSARDKSSSWRHVTYHNGAGSEQGNYDRMIISRGQTGMKVRISYVDQRGRVSHNTRSGRLYRSLNIHEQSKGRDVGVQRQRDNVVGISRWESSTSTNILNGHPHRQKTYVSARDRIFGSAPDKHSVDNPSSHSSSKEEEMVNGSSSSPPSMPAIAKSRHQLTTPTPCSSPIPRTTSPCASPSQYTCTTSPSPRTQSTKSTRRLPTSNHYHHHSFLNGINPNGIGPSSSAIMNGEDRGHVNSRFSVSSSSGKRVQANTPSATKERLRKLYSSRRVLSANSGGWTGPSGSVAVACGRLRRRRKISVQSLVEVVRDDDASPAVSRMFRKFRMVVFITINLIRLKAAIVVNSTDRTERSAAEIQWRTLYGQQEAEKLAFNKSHYSRERVTTKMPRWALEILDVRPELRTEQDCRRLHALFRSMRSFDKFTEEIQLNLCRAFCYTYVEESRIVLRRGHVGHNFYLIYSGSVFVNVQDVDRDGEPFIKTEAILARGDSFGELALLKDIRRTATVSVRETCELLVVDKDVFGKVCPKIFEKELMEKKNFIRRLSLFSQKWWSTDALSSLCMEAQIQEYKVNKIVVENNTTEEWVYVCMEGKCQVIRCLSEQGEEEEEAVKEEEDQTVIMSEEIIDLLASATAASVDRKNDQDTGNSKEQLLSSLGLEYALTGKRKGAFLLEVEEEERRKALLASSGPKTLTSLMAQKQKEGKTGLVYIKVGSLEAEDVFDMSSLINPPAPRIYSALLLVSSGARMLRLKKSLFFKLATPQAMEHTRTLVSKHPFPTEAAILDSYKKKVSWNAYKASVIQNVVKSRHTHSTTRYPEERTTLGERDSETTTQDRKHSPRRPMTSKDESTEVETKPENVDNKLNADENLLAEKEETLQKSEMKERTFSSRIFPILEVDTKVDPETARQNSSNHPAEREKNPLLPLALQYGVGPAPEAVIIHRRLSVGACSRPWVSVDTTFVTRYHPPSNEAPPKPVTRFNLAATTMDSASINENI